MDKKKTYGNYLFIVCAMMFSKVLGLLRDMLLANFYGTSAEAAAFSTASTLPLIFFDITLGTAISSAFIPVLNEYLGKENKTRAFSYTDAFLSVAASCATVLSLLGVLFSGVIVKIVAPGLDSYTSSLTADLLKIVFPVVILAASAFTIVGILQTFGSFKIPAIMSAFSNLALILYFLCFNDRFGIYGLTVALLIGWCLQLLILLPPLYKTGYRFHFRFDLKDEGVKKSAVLMIPVLISSWTQPINTLIGINVASFVGGGEAVSVLNYAYKIYLIVAGVFAFALTNIYFPKLSRLDACGKKEEAGKTVKELLSSIYLITAPVVVFFMLFSKEIISVVYERGEFSASAVALTAPALLFYSIGMLGFSFQEILNKYYYSKQDSKTPMKAGIVAIIANLVLSAVLALLFKKTYIVALASAISVTIAAGILLQKTQKGLPNGTFSGLFQTIFKSSIAAILSISAMRGLFMLLLPKDAGKVLLFFGCAGFFVIGAVIYIALLMLFRVEEIKNLFKRNKGVNL